MKMKKKCVLVTVVTFAVFYCVLCGHLLKKMDSAMNKLDRMALNRGLSPEKMDLAHQMLKPDCVCQDPKVYSKDERSYIVSIQSVSIPKDTCSVIDTLINRQTTDIQIPELYSKLQLRYDHYTFTQRGWLSPYGEVSYSSSQWDLEPLEVFIVPFSHADPGWIKNEWSYYETKAAPILKRANLELGNDPNMTFVWSEMVYLERWYSGLDASTQNMFKSLLSSGRFELLTGGWVMTDEAVSHYTAMLDQLVEGHQWLKDALNYTVHEAWSIDAFGVSPTMAYLLQRSGIKNLLIQRVHYNIKQALAYDKQLQFLWRQAWDPGYSTDVFVHLPPFMLYNILYSCGPEPEVCCQFDFNKSNCYKGGKRYKPEPITDNNVDEKSWTLLDQLRKKAQFFKSNKLLLLYGDDFRYVNSPDWKAFSANVKQLMTYMNANSDMHIKLKFSTLGEYFKATKSALGMTPGHIPSLSGDFLFYNDRSDQYWSGYYTSRPLLKYLIRSLQQKVRSADILYSLMSAYANSHFDNDYVDLVIKMAKDLQHCHRTLGLLHHHDAITGTARANVVTDYLEKLDSALRLALSSAAVGVTFLQFHNSNISTATKEINAFQQLEYQESQTKTLTQTTLKKENNVVAIFNPLASSREEFVSLTVSNINMTVQDNTGSFVACQVAPLYGENGNLVRNKYKLTFLSKIPPLAIARYHIKMVTGDTTHRCKLVQVRAITALHRHNENSSFETEWRGLENFVLQTPLLKAYFCGCTGLLQGILTKDNQVFHETALSFVRYGTGSWTNPLQDRSGAYIFLPNGPAREIEIMRPDILITEGPLVTEVITILPMVTHKVSLYNSTGPQGAAVYLENIVDISAFNNTELAMRLDTDINSADTFYTDLNGFQIQRRKRLSQYNIQGNYYPITTEAFIEDPFFRMSLLTSSSHGASSLKSGQLEVMLDRRLAQDDWRGLNEGVLDNQPTPSKFILLLETRQSPWQPKSSSPVGHASALSHKMSLTLNNPLELFYLNKKIKLPKSPYKPLAFDLPCDLHLVSLRGIGDHSRQGSIIREVLMVLHRAGVDCHFANMYEACHVSSGKLSIHQFFHAVKIKSIEETTLTGVHSVVKSPDERDDGIIDLPLMELKAFKVVLILSSV